MLFRTLCACKDCPEEDDGAAPTVPQVCSLDDEGDSAERYSTAQGSYTEAAANTDTEAAVVWRPSLKSMAQDCAAELCLEVERELRVSQSEEQGTCSGSATLAVLWSRFFHATDNAAFRTVALQVSPQPGKSALHFLVDLRKRTKQQRFGLECTEVAQDNSVLLVTGVERSGCVETWNDHCSRLNMPWKRIHLCAAVLAVNGVSGNLQWMRSELSSSNCASLVVCNPPCLHDAVTLLRMVRAAAPPPAGQPFWAKSNLRKALAPGNVKRSPSSACGQDSIPVKLTGLALSSKAAITPISPKFGDDGPTDRLKPATPRETEKTSGDHPVSPRGPLTQETPAKQRQPQVSPPRRRPLTPDSHADRENSGGMTLDGESSDSDSLQKI